MKTATLFALAILATTPVSAQTSMWGGSTAPGSASGMDCNQMISMAMSQSPSSNPVREAQAQHELSLAQSNRQSGNELACRLHAQNALRARG